MTVAAHKTKDWGASAKPNFVQSFTETKVEEFAKKNRSDFCAMNCRMLSRIYPKGSRVNSSNYDPTLAWSMGAQVVALNYQTWDDPMFVNDGRFKQNGRCGYVLKPSYLRDPTSFVPPAEKHTLTVKPICGIHLPGPHSKLELHIRLLGTGHDQKYKCLPLLTKQVVSEDTDEAHLDQHSEFCLVWDASVDFEYTNPEMAILLIAVVVDGYTIAAGAAMASSLREGVRAVPLRSQDSGIQMEFSTMLVQLTKGHSKN